MLMVKPTFTINPNSLVGLAVPHATKLAYHLARCSGEPTTLVNQANAVTSAVMAVGVTSAFAWEYAKRFDDSTVATSTRADLIKHFETSHGLTPKEAAKMADCIVFSAAKRIQNPASEMIDNMKSNASKALTRGINGASSTFKTVVDAVYYATADISYEDFLSRCKKNAK